MPTMMVIPAAIRKLRREALEISRRGAALASTGGVVAKKTSQPPPCQLYPPLAPPPAPRRRADDRDGARLQRSRLTTTPSACSPSRGALMAAGPAEVRSTCIGKGAQVRVRTRVGTVCTGQTLVFWLRAVVVSAADEDGYLDVAYTYDIDGKLPRVARVAPSDIKLHALPAEEARGAASSESSAVVTSDLSVLPPSSSQQGAARPTVAGKKLPLLMKAGPKLSYRGV